jgi:hypothetical protein
MERSEELTMKRYLFIYAIAGAVTGATALAQTPPPPQTPQRPSPTTPAPQQERATANVVTVEGCLMREAQVGRKPNVAERAGIAEDFILANAKVVKGSAPDVARTGQTPSPSSDATRAGQQSPTAMQPMYDVKEIDEERLKGYLGKRVQIEGMFADTDRQPTAASAEDLLDLRGTTIREVPGMCPSPQP